MTAIILAIDAATYEGSVALIRDGAVTHSAVVAMRGRDEERLMPAVAELLAHAGVAPRTLSRVVCGEGPGSFTSLRIAAAIAKGLAVAAGCELWGASSLALVVAGNDALPPGRYLAALDAMRGEHYTLPLVRRADGRVERLETGAGRGAGRHPSGELPALAASLEATLAGPGLATGGGPRAAGVAALLPGDLLHPVDLAAWEPDYGRMAEAQVKWEALHGRSLAEER